MEVISAAEMTILLTQLLDSQILNQSLYEGLKRHIKVRSSRVGIMSTLITGSGPLAIRELQRHAAQG